METEIIEKNKVPLYGRTQIAARITFTGTTPDREAVKQALVSRMKADKNLMVIERISTDYGFSGAMVSAQLYDSQEHLDMYRPKLGKKEIEKQAQSKEKQKEKGKKDEKPALEKTSKEEKTKDEGKTKADPAKEGDE